MEALEVNKFHIGKMLVSDPINSTWHISPASSIIPGTQAFDIFEKFESILQASSKQYSLIDQLRLALSNDMLCNNEELDIYAEPTSSDVWQVFTAVGNNVVVLLSFGNKPSEPLTHKVEQEVIPVPKDERLTSSLQASETYNLIISTNEWKNLVTPYSSTKINSKSMRKNVLRRPIFLQQAQAGNGSYIAILILVAIFAFVAYVGLSV
jgi:hypothetical protein